MSIPIYDPSGTAGDQILNENGSKRYVMRTTSDFVIGDLTGIDAAAVREDESWDRLDPITLAPTGIWVVSSAVPTFATDAAADAKVLAVAPETMLTDEATIDKEIEGLLLAGTVMDPQPSLAAVGDDFGTEVTWGHRVIELSEAHKKTKGEGVRVAIVDSGLFNQQETRLPMLEGLVFFGPGSGALIRVDRLSETAMASESVTIQLDGNLPSPPSPVVVAFGVESTLTTQAAIIDTALGGGGIGSSSAGFAAAINAGPTFALGVRYIVIGSNTPGGKVEVVSGTGTSLDKLGLVAGDVGFQGDIWGKCQAIWEGKLKYYKPVFNNNVHLGTDIDEAGSTAQINAGRNAPDSRLAAGSGLALSFRNGGTTTAASPTLGLGTTSVQRGSFVGAEPGDEYIMGTNGNADDGKRFTVLSVTYVDGENTNEPSSVDMTTNFAATGASLEFHLANRDDGIGAAAADFLENRSKMDMLGHGTTVSTMIAGQRGLGVAPGAQLVSHAISIFSVSSILAGLEAALDGEADIISMVWWDSLPVNDPLVPIFEAAIEQAHRAGINMVISMQEGRDDLNDRPAFSLPGVDTAIGVSGTGPTGNAFTPTFPAGVDPDEFFINSNFGFNFVDVAAPTANIDGSVESFTTWANFTTSVAAGRLPGLPIDKAKLNNWDDLAVFPTGGTSTATGVAVGVMALIRSILKSSNASKIGQASQAANLLKSGADDLTKAPNFKPGKDAKSGHGRVNARRSVNKARRVRD